MKGVQSDWWVYLIEFKISMILNVSNEISKSGKKILEHFYHTFAFNISFTISLNCILGSFWYSSSEIRAILGYDNPLKLKHSDNGGSTVLQKIVCSYLFDLLTNIIFYRPVVL